MINRNSLITVGAILLVSSLAADWQKIDDFEYDNPADIWNTWFVAGHAGELAIVDIIEDPADPQNRVLHFDNNAYATSLHTHTALVPKAETPVPDGGEVTLYWRWFLAGYDTAPFVAFVTEPNEWLEPGEGDNTTDRALSFRPNAWGDFRTVARPTPTDRRNEFFDLYDNNAYRIAYTAPGELFEFPAGQWFEFWKHVVNAPGATGMDEYSVYARPLGGEQVRLLVQSAGNPDMYFDTALFRGQLDGDLPRFRLISYTASIAERFAGDMVLYDDFYIDYSGLNLTTPPDVRLPEGAVEFWRGQRITRDAQDRQHVDLFFGRSIVDLDPWLWNSTMGAWNYLEQLRPLGQWLYVLPVDGASPLPVPVAGDMTLVDPEDPEGEWEEGPPVYAYAESIRAWVYIPDYDAGAPMWAYVYP